jgi:hypothetical protein
VVWIKEGDNNTKFFHQFSNYRRNINSIWDMKNEDAMNISSFKEKAEAGVSYFKNLFSKSTGCPN